MWLTQKIRNVVRGLKQGWASSDTKTDLWDKEYAGGRWDHCDHTPKASIYDYVYRYCRNGSVLDLGCGSGNTGNEMDIGRYSDYTGVDISEVAIKKAAARSSANGRSQKNRYLHDDIINYVPSKRHDLILFRESIYYVPAGKIKSMLNHYSEYLTEQGVFVVLVSGTKPKKSQKILSIINRSFTVLATDSIDEWEAGGFVTVFTRR